MKKFRFYSFTSALMLASAMGLGSCSSDSDATGGDSGVAGETVKTQFAINIPKASNGSRATADQTQGEGSNFLGMKDIWLLSFNSAATDGSSSTGNIALSEDVINSNESSTISSSSSSKVYQNVEVKTGTSHFVFYGFGKVASDNVGAFNQSLDLGNANTTALSSISFQLKPIVAEGIDYTQGQPKDIINALNTMEEKWNDADDNLKNIRQKFHQLKSGSAASVRDIFQDFVDYINQNYQQFPQALTQLKANINQMENFSIGDDNKVTTSMTFPRNIGLPDGAVTVKYDESTKTFAYNPGTGVGAMNINPSSITYPALLSYYANTAIYTNNTRVNNWPSTTSDWSTGSWTGWNTNNAKVESNTSAIALKDNINYGVASLKLQVKTKDATLAQNSTDAAAVNVPTEGFKVTGLLIGNQPDKVDYKFSPVDGDALGKTIWDNQVNIYAKKDDLSAANYTIVLPNNIKTDGKQKEVLFALELENNSDTDFAGVDGIVKKNAKFYIVGTLKPEASESGVTVPSGVTNPAVFMSDYQTEVKATISSLANAYNCIPDIRTTSLQLGLSVDLSWKEGFKYDIEIGGDN